MSLLDPSGRPMQLPLASQVDALRNELHVAFQLMQQLRMELLNQALKSQFVIKTLTGSEHLPEDMNSDFQEFVKIELARMEREAAEAQGQAIEEAPDRLQEPNVSL